MGYNQGACARKTSMNQKHSRIGLHTKRSQISASFSSILFDFNLGQGAEDARHLLYQLLGEKLECQEPGMAHEQENAKLKRQVAELSLEKPVLKDIASRNF